MSTVKNAVLLKGDCLIYLKGMEENSLDSMVTDPPAGISFMGKEWDHHRGGRKEWIAWIKRIFQECLRVLKPGAHAFVWAIPRTSHWTATALENAGFEVRDCVYHVFGSGFPKSLDVSKAIDKAAGVDREVLRKSPNWRPAKRHGAKFDRLQDSGLPAIMNITRPATSAAKRWQGFGTSLKPAVECWWLVRKPLAKKTVAANVLKWGTGALNIDASRIEGAPRTTHSDGNKITTSQGMFTMGKSGFIPNTPSGRFPANLVLSCFCKGAKHEASCAVAELDRQSGVSRSIRSARGGTSPNPMSWNTGRGDGDKVSGHSDSGGASRFFYCSKVSTRERNAGLMGAPDYEQDVGNLGINKPQAREARGRTAKQTQVKNHHPTIKAKKLMLYLIRMVTPPKGVVLDPFAGSGSTGIAALEGGFRFIGIEKEREYAVIARRRISYAERKKAA